MAYNPFGSWADIKGAVQDLFSSKGNGWFYQLGRGSSFNVKRLSDQQAVEEGYMMNHIVNPIINKIARSAAQLPYKLVEIDEEGNEIEVTDGELHDLIFDGSDEYTFEEMVRLSLIYWNTNGEMFVLGEQVPGFLPDKLIPLPPQLVTPIVDNQTSILSPVKGYRFSDGADQRVFSPDDIMHVRMTSPDVINMRNRNGLSPLNSAQNIVNASNNVGIAQGESLENRGVNGLISAQGGGNQLTLTPDDKTAIEKGLKGQLGGAHRFNSAQVVSTPVQYTQMGLSNADLEILNMDKQHLRVLCNHYGIASELFNDPEGKTYNNVSEAVKAMYNDVLIPNGQMFIGGINRKWIRQYSRIEGVKYKLVIDVEQITALQDSPLERTKLHLDMFKSKAISLEKFQELENINDTGDIFSNLQGLGNAPKPKDKEDTIEQNDAAQEAKVQAQASLRGSVGGVQGILAIQAQVAEGTTSESAALATLVEIYGFDEDTAKEILGV